MSFTGIGKTGQSHILTSPQDDAQFSFNSAMWCTHPLLGDDFMDGGSLDITAATIVTGTSTLFTKLCNNFTNSNIPVNKYIAYENGGKYGILEVDYVIDDVTLILKTPAFESANITITSQINQFGTPLLKEVEIRNATAGIYATTTLANKYATRDITLYDVPYPIKNEGGVEPQLILTVDTLVTLNY